MRKYSVYEASVKTGIPRSHIQNAVAAGDLEAIPRALNGGFRSLYYVTEAALQRFAARYEGSLVISTQPAEAPPAKKFKISESEARVAEAKRRVERLNEERWLKQQIGEF